MQKNVNTFGENVLGRSANDIQRVNSSPSNTKSNFPDAVDRLTDSPQYNPYQPVNEPKPAKASPAMTHRVNKPLPKTADYNDFVDDLREVNAQMGQLLGKCINVLERELFPDEESKEAHEEEDDDQKNPEATSNQQRSGMAIKEEASVIMALVGIKHVRDVLLGKQRELDASVANQIAQMHIDNESTETVDTSMVATENEERQSGTTDTGPIPKSSSAAEAPVPTKPAIQSRPDPATKEAAPNPTSIPLPPPKVLDSTYVSPHPLPSKPNVSYNINDLLSDTLKDDQVSPTRVNKDKFSWMLESNQASTRKVGALPTAPLFSSTSPGSSRPGTSANPRRSGNRSPATTSAVSVDPLDARNADKRKLYDL